jgi:hypothetical protein
MKLHRNAKLSVKGRELLVDRSSAPAIVANRVDERRVEAIAALRRLRMTGAARRPELAWGSRRSSPGVRVGVRDQVLVEWRRRWWSRSHAEA